MSTIRDLVQFADSLGQRKIAERRYQDQRNMQLAQIASVKDKENKVIQSQRFLNDAVKSFSQTGWNEDGTYTNNSPDRNTVIDSYLANMNDNNMAGDRFMLSQQLSQVNANTLMADAQKLTGKIAQWEAANADRKDDWEIFGGTYEKDKKAYLKKIGAADLYANLHGLGGTAKAMELTGLTPDSFDKKDDSWLQFAKDNKFGTTVGLTAAGATVWGTLGAMGKSIAGGDVLRAGKDGAIKEVSKLTAELAALKAAQPSKEVLSNISKMEKQLEIITKRGYIDKSAWTVLDKLKAGIPKGVVDNAAALTKGETALKAAEKALQDIKKPTMTSSVLKGLRGMAPWFAPEIGRAIDEKTGMPIPAAQTAGTAWLVQKAGKNLLTGEFAQFLKKRLPDVMAKVGKKAAAKHVASASTGIGANPYWQAGLLVTDLLTAGYAVQELYKEFEALDNN